MRIEGLSPDLGGIRNITERKTQKTASPVRSDAPDTVELTVGMGKKEIAEMSGSIPVEFPVREDVIETVSKRIASNTYDTPEVRETVAERLLGSPALSGAVGGSAAPDAPERTDKVETAGVRTAEGFYNQPEILESVAGKLVKALGL